jgi:uncharacterized protein involved in exopolysaccharide biosynthesis
MLAISSDEYGQLVRGDQPSGSRDMDRSFRSDEAGISIYEIVLLLVYKRFLLLLITCGFTGAALLIAVSSPPTYTATTTLLSPKSSPFSSKQEADSGLTAAGGLRRPTDLYVGLFKSATVEDGIIDRYNLIHEYGATDRLDARRALEDHVFVDGRGKDGLIRISVQAPTPARAAALANEYIDQYQHLSASLALGETSQRRLFLEQQMKRTKDSLTKAEEDLKETEETTGMIQLDSQALTAIASTSRLQAQIASKEVALQAMRAYSNSSNVDLQEAEQELSGLRAQLAKQAGQGEENDHELVMHKGRIAQASIDYLRKLREVKYNETILQMLGRQYENAKLDEAKDATLLQVVDIAQPPDRKSGPDRLLFTVIGLLAGFGVSTIWIVFGEGLRSMKADPMYAAKLEELRSSLPSPSQMEPGNEL